MKEINDDACYLDMPNGLHGHPKYNKDFVRAPKSDYPNKSSDAGKKCNPALTMKMVLGK